MSGAHAVYPPRDQGVDRRNGAFGVQVAELIRPAKPRLAAEREPQRDGRRGRQQRPARPARVEQRADEREDNERREVEQVPVVDIADPEAQVVDRHLDHDRRNRDRRPAHANARVSAFPGRRTRFARSHADATTSGRIPNPTENVARCSGSELKMPCGSKAARDGAAVDAKDARAPSGHGEPDRRDRDRPVGPREDAMDADHLAQLADAAAANNDRQRQDGGKHCKLGPADERKHEARQGDQVVSASTAARARTGVRGSPRETPGRRRPRSAGRRRRRSTACRPRARRRRRRPRSASSRAGQAGTPGCTPSSSATR